MDVFLGCGTGNETLYAVDDENSSFRKKIKWLALESTRFWFMRGGLPSSQSKIQISNASKV